MFLWGDLVTYPVHYTPNFLKIVTFDDFTLKIHQIEEWYRTIGRSDFGASQNW
jgi:hypothetical protein